MRNLMSNMRFMLLWSLGSIAAIFTACIVGFILFILVSLTGMALLGEELAAQSPLIALIFLIILFSSIGLSFGLIFGGIQKAVLRMRTMEPWRGWMIASAIGGVIGVDMLAVLIFTQATGYLMWMVLPPPEILFWFGFQSALMLFGCLGLSQMFVLAHYVRGAWVWILANMVAGVVLFSLLSVGIMSWAATSYMAQLLIFLICAAPGIVTGFVMVWLIESNWRQDY